MGTIAQPSASALYVSTEAAWGSTAGGNYQTARITSMDLRSRQANTTSQELSTSREPASLIRNDVSGEAQVNFEADVTDPALEIFLASAMGNTWSTALAISADIDVVNVASGRADWSATAGTFTSVNAGDWVKSASFVNNANNGYFYVNSKTSSSLITVDNPAAVAETTATGVAVTGSRLVFGTSVVGISMEQKVPTSTTLYEQGTGMVCSSMSFDIATGQIITGTAQFTGKNVAQSTSSIAGTPVAVGTGQICNAIDHVLALYEHSMGTAETWKTSRLSININSPINPITAIGNLGAIGVRIGRPTVTGNMNIWVEHTSGETHGVKDIHDAYLAGTQRNGIAVHLGATGATRYVFMFQKYGISNSGFPVGGNDSDFFMPLEIAAAVNSTTSTAFSVFKL